MTDAQTYTISLPITTCSICGERDWRHVYVLGAAGAYCRPCSTIAILKVERLQASHMAECWRSGVFSLTPTWKPEARK
jgi:hypothetical protein